MESWILLPVAVVNQDKGAEINGEFKNMGEELVKNLEENKTLDWNFVSAEEAEAGLESGNQYYAVITIPSNFSSSIASAQTVEKHRLPLPIPAMKSVIISQRRF